MMPDVTLELDRRMARARAWDDVLADIRRLDGFADFLRPPRLADLLPAAAGGPVVVINVGSGRCDALIVRVDGVEVLNLPDLRKGDVFDQVGRYLTALGAPPADRDLRPRYEPGTEPDALADITAWMWDAFAERILDHLDGPDQRVWWCPTGVLSLLPVHAAGHHDIPGAAVIDRVVSSYTPTLRALRDARRPDNEHSASKHTSSNAARMLVVALPEPPGQAPLPFVRDEVALLAEAFPGTTRTELGGTAATRAAVLHELGRHAWVHFSCHGSQDLDDPSSGGLELYDGSLTIADLSRHAHRNEFAFLSACKTATGGANLPDEAITLAAALHFTGFRHVIATLWSVGDRTAAEVAAAVYQDLAAGGTLHPDRSAIALHRAVRALRRRSGRDLAAWIPFVHIGP
ncbi:CHAT domain-containing protein [Dactylosporangium sp. NPDC051541]|uniref:CHAT domain-containing protein n=1 Tax=Dactylosporangium sp. NPDC051541 TaxID=3363977 RepID=UPI00379560CA